MFGQKLIPIPVNSLGYLGSKEEFISLIVKKSKSFKEAHFVLVEGKLYVFEGSIPEFKIPMGIYPKGDQAQ